MQKKLLIAGGTGLIGSALKEHAISKGWQVTILSRQAGHGRIKWDPSNGTIDLPAKMNFDAIINLAGTSVSDGRWTEKRKIEIYESRIKSCRTLENYLYDGRLNSQFYLGASGVGFYGDRGISEVNEKTQVKVKDWFTGIVLDWEEGHQRIAALEIRTVIFRIGIVLSQKGGALKEMLHASRFGVLAYFGSGRQIWSWIHIDDLIAIMFHCINQPYTHGVYLGTAPGPVSNKTLIRAIHDYMTPKKIMVGVPRFVMALILGEIHRVLFDSCDAKPKKLLKEGFQFRFPSIQEAIKGLASGI